MGFGVPAAIAARLTRPDRPVLALVGDGGFAMAATEMRIAASLGLPVTVVVFADNSLNRIELRQQSAGYPPTATRMDGMDLVALAEAAGCDGVRVDTPAALEKALAGLATRTRPPDRRSPHRPHPVRSPVLTRPHLSLPLCPASQGAAPAALDSRG
jgi:acetolactate synthase-1/2/3 large subunit